jgi:uncharacterized protein (TIGR01244 family)
MLQRSVLILLFAASLAIAGEASVSVKVDLGDVVEQGAVSPVDGITSAGQPDEAALSVFAENGYVAVIDMRTAGEERGLDEPAAVEGLGMQYVPFPISRSDVNLEMAGELDALLRQFDGPVLLHCGSGNRVGALLALREFLDSGDAEQALQTGRDGGLTSLESTVKEVIDAVE